MTSGTQLDAETLLTTTRAVRRRLDLDRPVEREVLLDCIRVASQAPTGSNAQSWRWVVVSDPDKRRRLAELYAVAGNRYLRPTAGKIKEPQTARVYSSAVYLLDILDRVPVHVIPCITGRVEGAGNAHAAAFYGSIFPAVWSFMLALRARGLGTTLTTLHLAKEQEAAELLGIPADVTQVGLLPVAYTTPGEFRPADRPPPEQVTYWDSWGS